MRAVVRTGPGILELNWMWLPTWIGMNAALKKSIEEALQATLVGQELDEEAAHQQVVGYLMGKFPTIKGLEEYLDGLKYIEI